MGLGPLSVEFLREILQQRAGGLLRVGSHSAPEFGKECGVCVRELRTLALQAAGVSIAWTDTPDGGSATDLVCQELNDGLWPSYEARTAACLPLALLTAEQNRGRTQLFLSSYHHAIMLPQWAAKEYRSVRSHHARATWIWKDQVCPNVAGQWVISPG